MTQLSGNQIYALAKQVGLSDNNAQIAAAIAMAESGGNTTSHNSTPPDDSYGLWQINMLGSLGPARRALYGLASNEALYDPLTNAKVMSAISHQGQNFTPWTTYTSGRYKQYLQGVTAKGAAADALKALIGGIASAGGGVTAAVPGIDAADAALSSAGATVDFLTRASDALTKTAAWVTNSENWVRIAFVIVGGAAALAGLAAVVRSTEAGQTAIKGGKKAVKLAAAAA